MKAVVGRAVRAAFVLTALAVAACGQNPESTEQARGVLEGPNLVVALTIIFVVIAGALLAGAMGLDRFVRSRRALEAPPPEPEEEDEEVVAGIAVGRGNVPRWLYAFYVLIPLFAFLYVMNNVALRPAADEQPAETEAPTGPQTEWTIAARNIAFDLDRLIVPAGQDVTVTMRNQDAGVPHDFTVWESEDAATANDEARKIAATNLITGISDADVTFNLAEPGEYYFNCTVHPPSMLGTIEAEAG